MAYTLPVTFGLNVSVAYTDQWGNPAAVDGAVGWTSSDEAVATVQPTCDDGMEALIQAGTKVGQAQITATADADLGAGVRALTTLMDVQVIAGEAVAGVITPSGDPIPPQVNPLR